MQTTPQKILDWTIQKINRDYPGQICLLVENSNLRIPGYPENGVDYFIPEDGFRDTLSRTFIIGGVGYDLYPRSWERMETMVNLDDYNTTCLADARIAWARSDADRERFEDLQRRLAENLRNGEFMYRKALEKLDAAQQLSQKLFLEENLGQARLAAGYTADYLAQAVACLNHTFFHYSQYRQLEELERMEKPAGFSETYEKILFAKTAEELCGLARELVRMVRRFLEERRPPRPEAPTPGFQGLADWYQELCYTWLRIYTYAGAGDARRTFGAAVYLQEELNIAAEEYRFPPMDLLSCYDPENLSGISSRARELEGEVRRIIAEHGVKLAEYRDFAEFASCNP